MSIYTVSADKSIFNLPKELGSIDISTRNDFSATVVGYEAAPTSQGVYNTIYGYRAGNQLTLGGNNVFVGTQAGENATTAEDNIVIGAKAGSFLTSGRRNVIVGNNSGFFTNGNQNILIGFNNTLTNDAPESSCNVSVGYKSSVFGNNNVSFGNDNYINSASGITLGSKITDVSKNSILLGNNIYNTGSNVFILNNRHNSNDHVMYNSNNDYININDVLIVNRTSNNTQQLVLSGDTIKFDSSNINFNVGGGNLNVNGNAQFSNITVLGTPTFCNLDLSQLLNSNSLSSNARFYNVFASNAELSNVTITGPINFQNTAWFGSNITFSSNVTMCNTSNLYITGGGLHIDERTLIKDLVVYGSITLCNGALTSNIGGGGGNSGGGGGIVFPPPTSNGVDYSNFPDGHFTHANVYAEVLTEIDDTLLVHSNLYVCRNIYTLGTVTSGAVVSSQGTFSALNVASNAVFAGQLTASNAIVGNLTVGGSLQGANGITTPYVDFKSNNTKYWRQWMDVKTVDVCADLIFESVNGSVVTFNDDFHPEVLNFTGKHRCVYTDKVRRSETDLIGKLVIASGKYCGLNGHTKPELDEAIPVVRLCKKANDSRVFGVFGGFEEKGEFHIGNITFRTGAKYGNVKRAVIQSVGEGCLWVCDINGKVKNGDFLCSSPIPGYAMKQSEDMYLNKTVAKATTSCTFRKDLSKRVRYKGKTYKCAFIGVTYKM